MLAIIVLGVAGAGVTSIGACTEFGEETTPGGDGGVDGSPQPAVARDLQIAIDWPTLAALDPGADVDVTAMRVVVTDHDNPKTVFSQPFDQVQRGPIAVTKFTSSNVVDVSIELTGIDGRFRGYGARKRWNLDTSTTIPVAVRKRILYGFDDRNNGTLHAFGLTPPTLAEPAIDETLGALPTLQEGTALAISTDGRYLVQAGTKSGKGALRGFETSSHSSKDVELPFQPAGLVAIGDGVDFLVVPRGAMNDPPTTILARVDASTGSLTPILTGLIGGTLDIASVAASPDGTLAAAVGEHQTSPSTVSSRLFVYDVVSKKVTNVDLASKFERVRGVRFTPDGKRIVVVGSKDAPTWKTGLIVTVDARAPNAGALNPLEMTIDKTHPSSLVLHPDGVHAFIGNETHYFPAPTPACCAEMRVVDITTGAEVYRSEYIPTGPTFEIISAVRLPYGARTMIGGQSDNGNNVNGPFVELNLDPAVAPTAVRLAPGIDLGSLADLCTPFGERL